MTTTALALVAVDSKLSPIHAAALTALLSHAPDAIRGALSEIPVARLAEVLDAQDAAVAQQRLQPLLLTPVTCKSEGSPKQFGHGVHPLDAMRPSAQQDAIHYQFNPSFIALLMKVAHGQGIPAF